jgi:hypothetical protein
MILKCLWSWNTFRYALQAIFRRHHVMRGWQITSFSPSAAQRAAIVTGRAIDPARGRKSRSLELDISRIRLTSEASTRALNDRIIFYHEN